MYRAKIGTVLAGEFDFNRRETLQRFQSSASRVVETFDKDGEFQRFSRGVQSALISSASLGLGAFSLGAASALLLPSTVLDVTGIMGASALALISIFILPARRRQLKVCLLLSSSIIMYLLFFRVAVVAIVVESVNTTSLDLESMCSFIS